MIFVHRSMHSNMHTTHFLGIKGYSFLTEYQCQCREHGSVHPGLGLCPQQSGSAFFCLVLSAAGLVYGAGEGLDDTSQDENAQTAKPHPETP